MEKIEQSLVSPQVSTHSNNKNSMLRQASRLGISANLLLALALVPFLFTIAYLTLIFNRTISIANPYIISAFILNISLTGFFSVMRIGPLLHSYLLKSLSKRWVTFGKAWKLSVMIISFSCIMCIASIVILENTRLYSEANLFLLLCFLPSIISLIALFSRFARINKLQIWSDHTALIGNVLISYTDLESVVRVPWQGIDLRLSGNAQPLECHLNDRDSDHLIAAIKPLLIPYGVRFNN